MSPAARRLAVVVRAAATIGLAVGVLTTRVGAQDARTAGNDAFVEIAREATDALAREARLFDEGAPDARRLDAAVDALRDALAAPGGLVPADGDDPARAVLLVDVVAQVRARLAARGPELRRAWRGRMERPDVERLGEDGALARSVATTPGTRTAARAGLARVDRALERGALDTARALLVEFDADVALLDGTAPEFAPAGERRRAWLAERVPIAPPTTLEATRLEIVAHHELNDPVARPLAPRYVTPGGGLRPGLAELEDGRVLVQSESQLALFRFDTSDVLVPAGVVDLLEVIDRGFVNTSPANAVPGPPGWGLAPTTAGNVVYLVQGRTRQGEEPNALVALVLPESAGGWRPRSDTGPLRPVTCEVQWAWAGDRRAARSGEPGFERGALVVEPALVDLATAEFQPGPVVVDELVVVQARVFAGAVEAWLVAFRRSDGALAWTRRLARGSDRVASSGRFGATARLASGPLTLHAGHVFAPTHLGTGSWVRASDGRVQWTVRTPRRAVEQPGWDGGAAKLTTDGDARQLVWAPSDTDQALRLPLPLGTSPAALRFEPAGEDRVLVDANSTGSWVLGAAGRSQTLRWQGPKGRVDALHLDPKELFRGLPARRGARLVAATDQGLYLFDLTRELYLVDFTPFESRSGGRGPQGVAGGDVLWRGEHLFVLGRDALWQVRAH